MANMQIPPPAPHHGPISHWLRQPHMTDPSFIGFDGPTEQPHLSLPTPATQLGKIRPTRQGEKDAGPTCILAPTHQHVSATTGHAPKRSHQSACNGQAFDLTASLHPSACERPRGFLNMVRGKVRKS